MGTSLGAGFTSVWVGRGRGERTEEEEMEEVRDEAGWKSGREEDEIGEVREEVGWKSETEEEERGETGWKTGREEEEEREGAVW